MKDKILVAYFSASHVTEGYANILADIMKSKIFKIEPKEPYTEEDLDWTNKNSRSTIEMHDLSSRPEILNKVENFDEFDTIFLGFPIWWYVAPRIINTFLESYDFSNKKIILFATSGSSNFGRTTMFLKDSVSKDANIIEGKILNRMSPESIIKWVESLDIL